MSWTFDYEATTTDLLDYCTAVLITDEAGGGKRGSNLTVGFLDGERWEAKNYAPLDIVLKTVLRYTNSSGAVTHTDGAAGHVYENLHNLKLLFGQPGLKYLTRDAPDYGAVRAEFEMIAAPIQGEQRHVYYWPLRIPSGSWQSETQSSAGPGAPPTVNTLGNRRIHDPQIVFAAAGTFTYTNAAGKVYSITAAAGPTYPVTLAHSNGEWTATDNGAADAAPYLTVTQPDVLVLDPNTNSLSMTSTSNVTISWRDRWA